MRTFHWITKCAIIQFSPIRAYYMSECDQKELLSEKIIEALEKEIKRFKKSKKNQHGR